MRRRRGTSETDKLQETVSRLPKRVADWTPEERQQYTTQSDRAMRERAGVDPNAS
ncbi:hypothetical protein [Streptomyces sp. NPDC051636]|uniref:hypothetical protein n=1 Tax=Streptomyces sp. NPDC051636 TaxID=3365663 RepID=UPI003790ABE3